MKNIKKIFAFCWTGLFPLIALAQPIVSLNPAFPTQSDAVTITYNASLGNGALNNLPAGQQVYAHTGLIVTGANGWQFVVGNWGTADSRVLMTRIGMSNLYTLTISPSIRAWYQANNNGGSVIPPESQILQLAFVFRNANGSLEGKTDTNQDIFVPISQGGFNAAITSHNQASILISSAASLQLQGQSSENANLSFSINGTEVASIQGASSLSHTAQASALGAGMHTVVFSASNGSTTILDTLLVTVHAAPQVVPIPAGREEGVTILNDNSIYLQLRAPFKQFAYVLGDFNNWTFDPAYLMHRSPDNQFFWIQINGLDPNVEYRFQYHIDFTGLRVTDPFVEKILDPWNDPWIPQSTYPNLIPYPAGNASGVVGVIQTRPEQYQWDNSYTWQPPAKEDLVVYELLIRDFTNERNFQSIIDKIGYLKALKVNAVQFMPLMEFDGNESWGYSTNFFMAVDKYYGTKNKLKELIDTLHKNGIAAILDVVYNHCAGQAPMRNMYFANGQPTAQNPWLNPQATHPFSVFYDFNHESAATKYLVKKSMKHWIQEFKFDGYRFDLSKGFTQTNSGSNIGLWNQYDQSRVNIIMDYINDIRSYAPNTYIILEHFSNWDEEVVYANAGAMMWVVGTTLYGEAVMGYLSGNNQNLFHVTPMHRGWNNHGLISYGESHDEERLAYKTRTFGNQANSNYNVRSFNVAMSRQALAAPFIIMLPGPKMIWQFGELGYDISIRACPDGTMSDDCRTSNKPVRWDYYDNVERRKIFDVYRKVNFLKQQYPAFRQLNAFLDLGTYLKTMKFQSNEIHAVIGGNFDIVNRDYTPGFTKTGWWYDYLSGDSLQVNNVNQTFNFAPGEFRIWLDRKVIPPANNYGGGSVSIESPVNDPSFELSLFPNPAQEQLYVHTSLEQRWINQISILDITGRLVKSIPHPSVSSNGIIQIDISALPAGAYFVQIASTKGNMATKFIKS